MGKYTFFIIGLIIIFAILQECECRRKILKGRNTINRKYMRPMGIPAWVVVLLVGIGELIVGGVIYLIMKKVIIDPPITSSYSLAPQSDP
ncbi:uncharacterized protein LOC132698431 [Cylas formicarius]|uniref:uncharacterized protein LOC132698431 n=1 Tax=Cylas formicarius TaxID=197179 RepID=UPI0029589AAC|nr:uncharacterized protein LOC132698431 [Cylas formicarius]